MRRLLAVLVLGALVVGCSEQATAPQSQRPAVNADFTNNPDPGNGVVYRNTIDDWAYCFTDPTNGLRVCHRTQPFPGGDCGDFEGAGYMSHQDILSRSNDPDLARLLHTMMGEVWITVRNTWVEGNCYGNQLVAEGWGQLHLRDNDVWGVVTKNSNAYGYSAQGMLTAPDGSRVPYNGYQAWVWRMPQGLQNYKVFVHAR